MTDTHTPLPPAAAGAAGRRRHLRADDGRAPVDGPVRRQHQHADRAGPGQRQPGVCLRPALVGADAAVRRHRRPTATAPAACCVVGVLLVALGTALIPLMTSTLGPDPGHRRAGRRRRRHGRAGHADGGDDAPGGRPRNAGWPPVSSTPVARSASSCSRRWRRASRRRPAGWRRCRRWRADAAGAAGGLGAARQPRSRGAGTRPAAPREGTRAAVARALADPSYRLLAAGFFVCGFHVAFLATHLPGVVAACGLPPEVGAWSLAMLGLFNIVGSLGIGWLMSRGGRWRMKSLLSADLRASRGVAVLVFVLAPKTTPVMLVFAAVMGADLPVDRAAHGRAGGAFLRPGAHGHAVRPGDGDAPDRRLPRRLAGRQGLRGQRQLRLDLVRRHPAGRRRRAAAPADQAKRGRRRPQAPA